MNANQMKIQAERKEEPLPEMTPIRLAFPPDNLSRVACEAIRSQWQLLDLEVELVELPVGRTFPEPDEDVADIVYVSAAVWEPVIDARRVLGPEGWRQAKTSWLVLDCVVWKKPRIGVRYEIVCLTFTRSRIMSYQSCHSGKWSTLMPIVGN